MINLLDFVVTEKSLHHVTVISGFPNAEAVANLAIEKLPYRLVPVILKRHQLAPFSDMQFALEVLSILYREKPDVLRCFTIKPILPGGMATTLARLSGLKVGLVWTFARLGKVFEPTSRRLEHLRRPIKWAPATGR